ncbi:MAG: ABC transporter ATP-binding protein [Hyphomicrobiales bacterium]
MFIAFDHVSKRFERERSQDKATVVAVKDITLGVARGEVLALVGPSGSGKTTLLRCLAGLETPDRGVIRIGDRDVFSSSASIDVPTERRDVGLIFQSYALWPHLTVEQNVAYPLERRKVSTPERKARVARYLDLVDCGRLAQRYPHELSGGQQQRIALARALVYEPAVVLFDEPLSNLDPTLREHLRSQIRELQRRVGFTGVYVTHDQGEAFYIGDRVALLNEGALAQCGTPDEIYLHPNGPSVASFVGATNAAEGELTEGGKAFVSPALGRIDIAAAPALSGRDAKCILMLRPESLRLGAPEGGRPQAVVVDRALIGASEEYTLQLPTGLRWRARLGIQPIRFKAGERVGLDFAADKALLFEASQQTGCDARLPS